LILYPCNNVADILGNRLIAPSLRHHENLGLKSYTIYNSIYLHDIFLKWSTNFGHYV